MVLPYEITLHLVWNAVMMLKGIAHTLEHSQPLGVWIVGQKHVCMLLLGVGKTHAHSKDHTPKLANVPFSGSLDITSIYLLEMKYPQ